MHKFTQKELLEEGFWDSFKRGVTATFQGAKEVANVFAPKTSAQISAIKKGSKDAFARIEQARKPIEERILDWMDEQGKVPIPGDTIKKGKNTPKGRHYIIKVAEKGINQKTGDIVPGKKYLHPQAIILYDREKETFDWVVKPRSDQFVGGYRNPQYWDNSAAN